MENKKMLCRGKCVSGDTWVKGYYCAGNERKTIRPCIFVYLPDTQSYDCKDVIPETVEPHIGLNDYKGMEIFIGDIVKKFSSGRFYIVAWDDEGAMVVLNCINHDDWNTDFTEWYSDGFVVVGNIHDNPELLGVRQ